MRLPSPITSRSARRAAALGLIASLSLGGLALAAFNSSSPAAGPAAVASAKQRPRFSISLTPSSRTVLAGGRVYYTVRISQRTRRRGVRLRVVSRLPAGVSSAIVTASTRARYRRLALRTTAATLPGTYLVKVRGYRRRGRSKGGLSASRDWIRRTRTLRLVVTAPSRSIAAGGGATRLLVPGGSAPVDTWVSNLNGHPVAVSTLSMTIASIDAPRAGLPSGCSLSDFAVRQFSGPSFVVPARSRHTLSELRIPVAQWPQLTMLNRPVSQDGCKGATLTLAFSAAGRQAR